MLVDSERLILRCSRYETVVNGMDVMLTYFSHRIDKVQVSLIPILIKKKLADIIASAVELDHR